MRQLPYDSGIDALVSLSIFDKSERERLAEEERKKTVFTILDLADDVCTVFDSDLEMVLSGWRRTDLILCKRILIYVAYKRLGMKKVDIGKFTNCHHTSVIYHINTIEGFLKVGEMNFVSHWKYYLHNSKYVNEKDFT